jgi:hypothetical protein
VLSPVGQGILQKWSFVPVGATADAPAHELAALAN